MCRATEILCHTPLAFVSFCISSAKKSRPVDNYGWFHVGPLQSLLLSVCLWMIFFRCETYRPLLQNLYIDYFSIQTIVSIYDRSLKYSYVRQGKPNLLFSMIDKRNKLSHSEIKIFRFFPYQIRMMRLTRSSYHQRDPSFNINTFNPLKKNKHKILKTDDIKLVVNNKAHLKCQWQLWFEGKKHSNCGFGISFDKSWGETCNIELTFFMLMNFNRHIFKYSHFEVCLNQVRLDSPINSSNDSIVVFIRQRNVWWTQNSFFFHEVE